MHEKCMWSGLNKITIVTRFYVAVGNRWLGCCGDYWLTAIFWVVAPKKRLWNEYTSSWAGRVAG